MAKGHQPFAGDGISRPSGVIYSRHILDKFNKELQLLQKGGNFSWGLLDGLILSSFRSVDLASTDHSDGGKRLCGKSRSDALWNDKRKQKYTLLKTKKNLVDNY